MTSIKFPKMFKSGSTNVTKTDKEATLQNLKTLIGSERGDFKIDPEFGIAIKQLIYDQNNYVLRDIVIDELYTQISLFMPQLLVSRKDITITHNRLGRRAQLEAHIKVKNILDFTTDMYDLVLFQGEEL